MQTNYLKSFWSSNFEYLYLKLAITGNRFVMPKWQGFVFNRTFPVNRHVTLYPLTRKNLYGRETAHRVAIFVTNTHTQLLLILGSATPNIQSSSSLGSSCWFLKTPKDTAHAMASHTPSDTLPKTQEQPCKQPAGGKKKKKRWPLVLKQDQELTTPTPTASVTTTSVTQFSTVTSGDTQSVWIARLLPVISCAISLVFARSSNLVFCWALKSAQLVN